LESIADQEQHHFRITSILRIEHRLLRELMQAMEHALLAKLPASALRERATMLEVALDTHATREEEQLFTQMRTRSERAEHLVEMMEIVHGEVRDLFGQVQNDADPPRDLWTILELTAAHFDREEKEVFPLAEELLETAELMRLVTPSPGK
jgi:hemerythrin-like domain-containing protein